MVVSYHPIKSIFRDTLYQNPAIMALFFPVWRCHFGFWCFSVFRNFRWGPGSGLNLCPQPHPHRLSHT